MNSQERASQRHQLTQLALCIAMALPALATAQMADHVDQTLPAVGVKATKQRDTTEGTGSYTATGKTKTATPLSLSLRDTPQSVSVVTQQRMQDQSMLTVTDACPRRSKSEPPCRSNIEPGLVADQRVVSCG